MKGTYLISLEFHKKAGTHELTQPTLINSILEELKLDQSNSTTKNTPGSSSKTLNRHPKLDSFDGSFHHRRVIGKLNFLASSTRADMSHQVHQCARFSVNPKAEHGKAVKWIGGHLKATADKGHAMKPDPTKGLEVR